MTTPHPSSDFLAPFDHRGAEVIPNWYMRSGPKGLSELTLKTAGGFPLASMKLMPFRDPLRELVLNGELVEGEYAAPSWVAHGFRRQGFGSHLYLLAADLLSLQGRVLVSSPNLNEASYGLWEALERTHPNQAQRTLLLRRAHWLLDRR